jgi:ATPase subunit of ABC transporter with duplicated ATPase domains
VNPFIRFDQEKKLHRQAVEITKLSKEFDNEKIFSDLSLMIEAGEKIAIIGPNGIGKTTLLRCLAGDLEYEGGNIKWAENAQIGYFAQDHASDFEQESSLLSWMGDWGKAGDDDQVIRGTLGRLLFGRDDLEKSIKVLSGGEQSRMLFGKLILQKPNVLLMDEPTNHLDMESIESLNLALENFPGTIIFVSHDREFVSSIASRIIELTPTGIRDFVGTYDEYLESLEAAENSSSKNKK